VSEPTHAARVRALLGRPEYARLVAAIREAVEGRGARARSVAVDGLDARERRALADLAGWEELPEGRVRVDLDRLDLALRESALGVSLRKALALLGGPLADRPAEARGRRAASEAMWAAARDVCRAEDRDDLLPWLDGLRRSGALSRAAGQAGRAPEELLGAALGVALRLPADGVLLAVFAARHAGDPHALDAGTPLGGLVLRAAQVVSGIAEAPASSPDRRRIWRAVGVDCDALSADVLVLGLRPEGDGLAARQLRDSADEGEPRRLTLREVSRASLSVRTGLEVFVCENPAVVEAAADRLGPRCAPLVCVEGVPSTAALALLRALAASGARVRVHADLDWAGVRIAGQVLRETGGVPWRMSAGDYRAALAAASPHPVPLPAPRGEGEATAPRRPCHHERRGPGRLDRASVRGGPPLGGRRASAGWEPELERAMLEGGRAVLEEQVLQELLGDLERPAGQEIRSG
jgi:uncharacterized protein (TIGR02679 family)